MFADLAAPAGSRIATRSVRIDGYNAAILPNGRLLTPVGFEVNVDAPNAYGMAVTYDGKAAATINSGASRFSVSLVRNISATSAELKRIPVNATFMGVVFSPDGSRFYASGGENGNVWVGETATARIIGSVNLNGATKPLPSPSLANPFPDPARNVITSFRGSFPAAMALTVTGKYLYVLDQAAFAVHVIDTAKLSVGLDADNKVIEMNNFPAVVGNVKVGRYPFGLSLSPDDKRLYVANVGVFQFKNLSPRRPAHRRQQRRLPPVLPGDLVTRTTRSPTRPSRSRSWPPAGRSAACPPACVIRTASAAATSAATRTTPSRRWATPTPTSRPRSSCWTWPARRRPR